MLIIIILLIGLLVWREYKHQQFVKWIFLDWAYKFKTGEFEQGPIPEAPDLNGLMKRFLTETKKKASNKNAIERNKLVKSGVI